MIECERRRNRVCSTLCDGVSSTGRERVYRKLFCNTFREARRGGSIDALT